MVDILMILAAQENIIMKWSSMTVESGLSYMLHVRILRVCFLRARFARTSSQKLVMFAEVLHAFYERVFARTFSRRLRMFFDVLRAFFARVFCARFRGGL